MKNIGPKSTLIALVAGIVSIAPLSAVDTGSECLVLQGKAERTVRVVNDESIPLIEARLVRENGSNERRGVIGVNWEEIDLTYLSPETVNSLFRRECARLQLGQVGKDPFTELTEREHREADCSATQSMNEANVRDVDTIIRDLHLAKDEDLWPDSMGQEHETIGPRDCLD